MKKIATIALALIAATSMTMVSAQQKTDKNDTARQSKTVKVCKKYSCQAVNPFEGLNLTEKQQKALEDLRPAAPATDKAQKKADRAQAKAEKMQQKMVDRTKARTEYLAKVKSILTADQYVKFLENSYVQSGVHKDKQGMRQGKDMKRSKDMKRGKDMKRSR